MDINFILKFWFTLFPNLNKYFIVIISGFLGIICFGVFIGLLCEKRNEKLDNIYVGTSIVFLVCAIFFLFTARSFDKFEIPNVGYEEKTEIVESVELTDYILKTDIKGDNQFLHKIYGEITTDNIFHFRVIKEDGYSYFNKIAYDKDTFRHYHDETNTPKLEKIVTTKILKTYQNDKYSDKVNQAINNLIRREYKSKYEKEYFYLYAPKDSIIYFNVNTQNEQ